MAAALLNPVRPNRFSLTRSTNARANLSAKPPPGSGVSAMKPLDQCSLYTFVDTAYLRGRSPEAVTHALCDGGSDLIQLRAKDSSVGEIRQIAHAILPI